LLRALGHWIGSEIIRDFADVERALVNRQLQVERDQSNQSDECAEAEVKRDLKCRVVLDSPPAPDADHDKRRHKRQLMKEIKEKQIERRERAKDAAGHHEQQDVKFLFAFLDFPRDAGGGESNKGAHEDQANVDAVHAETTMDAETVGTEQRNGRDELIAFRADVEAREKQEAQQRDDERRR